MKCFSTYSKRFHGDRTFLLEVIKTRMEESEASWWITRAQYSTDILTKFRLTGTFQSFVYHSRVIVNGSRDHRGQLFADSRWRRISMGPENERSCFVSSRKKNRVARTFYLAAHRDVEWEEGETLLQPVLSYSKFLRFHDWPTECHRNRPMISRRCRDLLRPRRMGSE